MKWISYMPKWDENLFDGTGGFVGEDENTTYICDVEYETIDPWPGKEYVIFSHKWCERYGNE